MDKQRKNIKLEGDYKLRLKTNRVVETHNPIVGLFEDKDNNLCIEFRTNRFKKVGTSKNKLPNTPEEWKYTVIMYLKDYLALSLWAHNVKVNSSNVDSCSVVFDTGWSQVAVTGTIANVTGKKKAMMRNYSRVDLRRSNVFFNSLDK